jgi:ribosomal protein S18 acetylase RimI-like enzyme
VSDLQTILIDQKSMRDTGTDRVIDGVHRLVADGVERGEALGLSLPPTRADYRSHIGQLLADRVAGNAGLAAAAKDGVVVGTAQWRRSGYATRRALAEIDRVVVSPSAWGTGIGRALVEAVVADAQRHGVEVVTLEVRGNNHGAIALYESCAFTRCGLIPNAVANGSDRFDIVLMVRELSRPAGLRLIGSAPVGAGSSTRHPTSK